MTSNFKGNIEIKGGVAHGLYNKFQMIVQSCIWDSASVSAFLMLMI